MLRATCAGANRSPLRAGAHASCLNHVTRAAAQPRGDRSAAPAAARYGERRMTAQPDSAERLAQQFAFINGSPLGSLRKCVWHAFLHITRRTSTPARQPGNAPAHLATPSAAAPHPARATPDTTARTAPTNPGPPATTHATNDGFPPPPAHPVIHAHRAAAPRTTTESRTPHTSAQCRRIATSDRT